MKYLYIAGAIALMLFIVCSNMWSYEHGKSFQKGLDAQNMNMQWQEALNKVSDAQKDASKARSDQIAAAETHAKELAAASANVRVITKEIPKYVQQIPDNRNCDISDGLFDAINKAAATTGDF